MCDEAVDNYPDALKFPPDYYKTQIMCDKPVNSYDSTMEFVPECHKTQEMCHRAVNRCFLHLFTFLTDIKLNKCVKILFPKILL